VSTFDFSTPAELPVAAAEIGATFAPAPATHEEVQLPDYLVRFYDWAYLWPVSVWFFDHQPIINAILFGNYRRIMNETLRLMEPASAGKTLQIAAVYGELTPTIARHVEELHVIDAAAVQLKAARRKLNEVGRRATLGRMVAESLKYGDRTFDTSILFFLLHELPAASRRAALREAVRVLKPGGQLLISEYGEHGKTHWFHRFGLFRGVLTWAEPFLGGFWKENLTEMLKECGRQVGREVELEEGVDIFRGFYRVRRYRVR
jgi:ubiquinone/menaquinone biosynthesis C-methylase UbiE